VAATPRHSSFDLALDNGNQPWQQWLVDLYEQEESACQFCNRPLRIEHMDDIEGSLDAWHSRREYKLAFCEHCAAWSFRCHQGSNACMDPTFFALGSSVAARYSDTLPEGCSQEIAQQLRRYPRLWHTFNPSRFERFLVDVFRSNHAGCEVIHVGGPGDGGVDLYLVDDTKKKWVIQVKRRARPRKSEPFSTVQSVLGTLVLEGSRYAIVATTSDAFSWPAQRARLCARQSGFTVELFDRGVLDRMLGPLLPRAPWRRLFEDPRLAHIIDRRVREYFVERIADQLTLI